MAPADKFVKAKVEEQVALQPAIVFSKSSCESCTALKETLRECGARFACIELDSLGEEVQAKFEEALAEIAGSGSLPHMFAAAKLVPPELHAKPEELKPLVEAALVRHVKAVKNKDEFQHSKSDEEWHKKLDKAQYKCLRERGTERPGSHSYDKFAPKSGYFSCAGCGLPLYSAESKFQSTCGWPVFNKVYESSELGQHVLGRPDGGRALEIVCSRCGSHLGHVFYDSISEDNPNGERH